MNIKQFIDEYNNCPLCNNPIAITSDQANKITILKNRLTISMRSDYFVEPNVDSFEFSISIINGNILFTNSTNQFISLYDLSLFLRKECDCRGGNAFSRCIEIFYDRTISSFSSRPYMEHFYFIYNDVSYVFINNYNAKISNIIIGNSFKNIIKVRHIPFEKFDFSNREKLFSKINSILLLA
jgi:hypothetical protein